MQELDRDGVRTRFTTTPGTDPTAPPVLLVHGFGSNHAMNWRRTGWVRELTEHGRATIGVDLRGHGLSDKLYEPDAYLPTELAADLVTLLDLLEVDRADVLAYSMGSRLTWQLALTHPHRVRRAVLGGFGPANVFAGTDLYTLSTGGDGSPFARLFALAAAMPGNDPAALAACARGQAEQPFTPDPAPRDVPLLFAAGSDDTVATGVDELAAGIPGAVALRLPGRDHMTALGDRELKKAVVEFLRP